MDYLSATRIVNSNVCAVCSSGLSYRIDRDGEYVIMCPHNPEHHEWVRIPTLQELYKAGKPLPIIVANRFEEEKR